MSESLEKYKNLITLTFYPTSHTYIRGKCPLLNTMKVWLDRVIYFLFNIAIPMHVSILVLCTDLHRLYSTGIHDSQRLRAKIGRIFSILGQFSKLKKEPHQCHLQTFSLEVARNVGGCR